MAASRKRRKTARPGTGPPKNAAESGDDFPALPPALAVACGPPHRTDIMQHLSVVVVEEDRDRATAIVDALKAAGDCDVHVIGNVSGLARKIAALACQSAFKTDPA